MCADVPLEEQLRLDALCRAQGSAFIATEMCGVFGKVFCDFGDEFVVTDTTGENPVTCMVSSISQVRRCHTHCLAARAAAVLLLTVGRAGRRRRAW